MTVEHNLFRAFWDNARNCNELQRQEWQRKALRFNVFRALRTEYAELLHSRFLAFLLDPRSRHDQGDLFLRSFLQRIGLPPVGPLDATRVHDEYPIRDMSRRLDILIENGAQFVVVIENKVYALETSGQIADYQKWLSDRLRGAAKGLLVFLTRKGSAPEGQLLDQPRIHRLSYGDVGRWLGTFTGLPPSLGATVRMYADICGELGSDAMNTQIEEDFSQILEGSSDLALALKISRWAEGQRTATFDEFWNEVQRQLDQKLHEWDLTKSWKMHRFPHSSKQIKESRGSLCIVPTSATADPLADAGWRPPCFTVMAGNTHGGQEPCYYGIRAWGPISAMDQSNREYHELAETFRSLRFFVNHGWFVAYAYTTEEARELPDFQMENDDSVVRLFEDNHAANRPYATLMATKIWEVFDKAHAALERLNAAKLAQI